MAPESLKHQLYSKKSDVWSFGIVVYEIVARREPHTDVNPLEVGLLIRDQYLTPKIPSNCHQKLRQLMEMCWNRQPEQRPVSSNILSPSNDTYFPKMWWLLFHYSEFKRILKQYVI